MPDEFPHGEYRGWNRHQREGTHPCKACSRAQADYMAKRRRDNPEIREREKVDQKLRFRALWRLARLFPAEYAALVEDEKAVYERWQAS